MVSRNSSGNSVSGYLYYTLKFYFNICTRALRRQCRDFRTLLLCSQ